MQSTLQGRDGPNLYRKTAITVGVIYLLGTVFGVGGNIIVQSILGAPDHLAALSTNSMLVAIGAQLWLLSGTVIDAAHGILMFPVVKQFSERIAVSVGTDGLQSESHPYDSRWPMGAVHGRVADR